jgi:hypothetical protein
MSENDILDQGIHLEAALLPWYANGTLSEVERHQVARHLQSCVDCSRQYEEVREIRSRLRTFYEDQPAPSREKARQIFTKIAQKADGRPSIPVSRESWQDRVDNWIRALFVPQWVPTLAATLIFVQFGLLVWLTIPEGPSDQITTRSLSSPTVTFKVTFHELATEKQIRALLTDVRGKIVGGPTPDQAYLLEVVGGSDAITGKTLEALRATSDVVRTAEVIESQE